MDHLRQHLPTTQSQQYICCYDPSTSGPLIMLANHQHILNKVQKDLVQPYYFWIYSDPLIAHSTIQLLSNLIKNRSIVFTTIAQIHEFITPSNKMNFKKIILVSSSYFKDNLSVFARTQQFLGVVLFDVKDESEKNECKQKQEGEGESLEVGKSQKDKIQWIIKVCWDLQQLNRFLNMNHWSMTEIKPFPNFVSLKQELQKSTVLYRTMIAMIKSQIQGQTRSQVLSHLEYLIKKLAKPFTKLQISFESTEQAILAMKKRNIDLKTIIGFYTAEKYRFNIVLNNLLRVMDCPTQMFCVQPFFKELFDAVQQINSFQPAGQIICYRGGLVSSIQMLKMQKNTGEIVQNLGFLSSSLRFSIAFSFKKNIFYNIYVPNFNGKKKVKRGFANISSYSHYFQQLQILFNPLCYFLLTQVKQHQFVQPKVQYEYQIFLSYIDINEEVNKQSQDQSDKITKILVSLLEQMHCEINSQSDLLLKPQNKAQVQKSWIYCKFLMDRDENFVRILKSIEIQKEWNFSMEMKAKDNIGLEKIQLNQMELQKSEICHYLKLIENVGSILYFTGHFKQALDFYYKCLDIQKNMLNDTETNYLSTLNQIALSKIELGKANEVLQIYRTVELTGKEILGQKNPIYLKYCNNIVLALSMLTRYSEAFDYFTKWENLAKQVFSQYHPVYIKNLINKAHILQKLCRYEQAYDISKKCQFLMRNVLREDNMYYVNILHQMVNCLTKLSRFSQAETIYKKNEKIMRQIVGENNPKYYLNMTSLGNILWEQGKYKEALIILKSCLDIVKSNFGEDTRYYTFILSKIGDSLLAQGKHIEALDFYRKCQSIERRLYDNNSPVYLMNYIRIGTAFMRRGYYNQALSIFKQKQRELKIALGQKHPYYLLSLKSICQACIRLRRNKQALEYCRKIERLENQVCNDKGMNMIGDVLVQNQKVDEGLKYFLQFQQKFKNIYGERHPYYFGGVARIANAFIIKCKFNEAFELFTQNLKQGLLNSNNQSHVLILQVIMNFFICLGDFVALLSLFFKFKSQFMSRYFYSLYKILELTKMYKQLKLLLRLTLRQIESKGIKSKSREDEIFLKQYKQKVKTKQGMLQRKINNKCFLNF